MNPVKYFGCYDYNDELLLIDMVLDIPSDAIPWSQFCAPEAGLKPSDWQVPYMEQYLNEAGTERICELYDEPAELVQPCRTAFFLFKTAADHLQTPYGDFDITTPAPVPQVLQEIIEFEED